MGHDIREAKGSEKKRSGFELTAAECSKSALVVRVNEHELELPTVVQVECELNNLQSERQREEAKRIRADCRETSW